MPVACADPYHHPIPAGSQTRDTQDVAAHAGAAYAALIAAELSRQVSVGGEKRPAEVPFAFVAPAGRVFGAGAAAALLG